MEEPGKSRGRAETWRPWAPPRAAAGTTPAWAWPAGISNLAGRIAGRIREWLATEGVAGALVPWLAIGFGTGIIIYFSIAKTVLWDLLASS